MRQKKTKRVLPKIIRPWALIKASVRAFLADWKPYLKILAVIAIPANIVAVLSLTSADQVSSAYVSFASVIMNVAFIWALTQHETSGKVPGIAAAYYEGSTALVRFLVTSALLVIMLVPAALGAALYSIGLQVADVQGTGPEQILIGVASLVLTIPSLFLMTRYGLAPFAVVRDNLRPMAALRRARRLTLGRFWNLAGRYVMLGIYLAILSIPASMVAAALDYFNYANIASGAFALLATLWLLPITNIFLYRLYQELNDTYEREIAPDEAIESDDDPEPERAKFGRRRRKNKGTSRQEVSA